MPARYTKAQKAAYARRMRKNKKKRAPAKKRAYKQSYQIAKLTAPLMPKTRLVMLNYVQRFRLDPQPVNADNGLTPDISNSLMAFRTFTINNLKDMDEMTSGIGTAAHMNDEFANHQPRGYSDWGQHYNSMTVLSTRTQIDARNTYSIVSDGAGTTTHTVIPPKPVAVGYLTSHFNKIDYATAAGTKFNDVLEQKQIRYKELNDDRQKVSLIHKWSLKKEPTYRRNLNMEASTSDYAWGSLYNQDILSHNKRYLHIVASPLGIKDNSDPYPIDLVVQISSIVLLGSRNEMQRSGA